MSDDQELIYVRHHDLDAGAWVPRSSLRQLGTQGWVSADPPPSKLDLAADADSPKPAEDATSSAQRKSRARGTNTEEKD